MPLIKLQATQITTLQIRSVAYTETVQTMRTADKVQTWTQYKCTQHTTSV